MNSIVPHLGEYSLECEYTFTFFAIKTSADLKIPKIRGGRLAPSWQELAADVFYMHANRYAIEYGGEEGESLTVGQFVGAYITITLNRRNTFEAELSVYAGRGDSKGVTKAVDLPPDSRIPFMIYRRSQGGDEETKDTAAVLQGVLATGPIYGQMVQRNTPF